MKKETFYHGFGHLLMGLRDGGSLDYRLPADAFNTIKLCVPTIPAPSA